MPTDLEVIRAIKKALPSVVSIVGDQPLPRKKKEPSQFWGLIEDKKTPLDFSSELKKRGRKVSSGSGFIIEESGVIATNSHLISPLVEEYRVVLNSGDEFEAKILATDFLNDLVFLKVSQAKQLPVIQLGDSSKLELGQTAIAIGTALGEFQNSVSVGVVSGLSRFISAKSLISGQVSKLRGLIQTDAAINPGNSGGPLIDLSGQVIGVNTALVFGAENIGFAIPANHLREDLAEVKKYGRIRRPFLGVRYLLLNKQLQERNKLPVDYGALVVSEELPGDRAIIANSPAEKAGLKEFDIILECQNKKISAERPLEDILRQLKTGQEIRLKVLRDKKELLLKTALAEKN
ncbi:MAG: trypsin-like peptidase domain-containing protein [Candidatus Nealsonbacteria bacterium]|nr:trypsin-like peptidase domain-containing protein [Candidatus Nealsonbacteria bacterium]